MPFSIASFVRKAQAVSSTTLDCALLDEYAEFSLDLQKKMAKGERGIVVLSLGGDEPIFAQTEDYFTHDGKVENNNVQRVGLARTAGQYQAEQQQLAKMNADAHTVNFDIIFDTESPEEEKDSFLGFGFQ